MITPSFGAGGSPRSSTSQESFTGNMGHPPMPLPRAHIANNSKQVSSPSLTTSELQAPDYS